MAEEAPNMLEATVFDVSLLSYRNRSPDPNLDRMNTPGLMIFVKDLCCKRFRFEAVQTKAVCCSREELFC